MKPSPGENEVVRLPQDKPPGSYRAVVMGASAGGMEALRAIFSKLPPGFNLPILVVLHVAAVNGRSVMPFAGERFPLQVEEAYDKARIQPGRIYMAPANYHMLVERNGTIALSVDDKVNWSRPSIDVLFESAALALGSGLIAVILSGANADGAQGMRLVKACGGLAIAQDPDGAQVQTMPRAAIEAAGIETVLAPHDIAKLLARLGEPREAGPTVGPLCEEAGR